MLQILRRVETIVRRLGDCGYHEVKRGKIALESIE